MGIVQSTRRSSVIIHF